MARRGGTRRLTADEVRAEVARGESRTDLARVDALTETQLDAAIAADPDWRGVPPDWHLGAEVVPPGPKTLLSLRLDPDVVAHFRAGGSGYQTRMNAVLRAYVRAARGG